MIGVQGVAGAGVVAVSRPIRFQDVVGGVLQSPETQCRSFLVPLRGVIVHDIENHFESGPMQGLHHVAELVDGAQGILPGTVGRVRSKERYRAVAPVVHAARRAVLEIKLENRQQFDGGNPEILQVGNLLDQPAICATLAGSNPRIRVSSEAGQVHFINHSLGVGMPQRLVPFPIVSTGWRDDTLHRLGRVVARRGGRIAIVAARHSHGTAIGIQQHFLWIEPEAPRWVERPVDAITVELPWPNLRDESVPIVVGSVPLPIEREDMRGHRGIDRIKEEQLHVRGVFRVQREIHAITDYGGAKRKAAAGRNVFDHFHRIRSVNHRAIDTASVVVFTV